MTMNKALQRQGGTISGQVKKAVGEDRPDAVPPCDEFWYMRPDYEEGGLLIDPDVGVRGGTISALVERLTSHEYQGPSKNKFLRALQLNLGTDPAFTQTFLATFKSFTTLDKLFDHLVARFNIQPPPNLNPEERRKWVRLKQLVVQTRFVSISRLLTYLKSSH
jgi:son of sevenless